MANLNGKIKQYLIDNGKVYKDEKNNYQLQNDNGTDYIKSWNVSGLTEPNDSQLNSYDSAATTAENNNKVRNTRRKSYGSIGDQLDEIYADIDAWRARIKKIKDANAKE
jgi:hypothetical protein